MAPAFEIVVRKMQLRTFSGPRSFRADVGCGSQKESIFQRAIKVVQPVKCKPVVGLDLAQRARFARALVQGWVIHFEKKTLTCRFDNKVFAPASACSSAL